DNAGIARILTAFQYIEIDLNKYLVRYKKFFYSSYGLEGQVEYEPTTKRHIFKTWEEVEEEAKPEEQKKTKIATEEPDLSFGEWKKKFREEHPEQKPTFQLYTIQRLEKRKEQLLKELKKTSGVFKDKLNLRLTFTEALIEAYQKEIKVCEVGTPEQKLPLEASDKELQEARPPGVGKSFISEMLAEAMGLEIEVISMNGKKETSIFFGVPQEWAGAGVGEILKTMIKYKTRAPIILLDEFEKCDKSVQQVLGNLTDETLNKKFKD
ncbi:10953_t:CDS:2, partial [Funneliformis geosporum]